MAIAPVLTINQLKQGVRLTQMNNVIIQATITRQLISFFDSKITVGKAYNIRNLTFGNNSGYDKATPNPCRLKFEFSSKLQEINDTSIPVHGYQFSKFADIIGGRCPTTHYIDVVGKLYEIGPIIETRHWYRCRTIKLEDIDGCQLSCTLWPPYIDLLPALISEQPNPNQSKIIVMQCVETKKFEGQWRIQTTYNATAYHINPDIPEVNIFEERFQVKFIVADMTDEEAAFVVFDSQITQFINHTTAQLLAEIEMAGDHDSIPRELEAFIDKSFVFKIEILDKYNAELDTFKTSTKDMMFRVANAKVIKASKTKDLSDVEANNLHGSDVHSHQVNTTRKSSLKKDFVGGYVQNHPEKYNNK
ncbi:hypothetical protein RND81_14G195600 [Saponaria officinalis]|uniref:Replication protein A1 n=1 Tax=Saponaria officinalis TaxID=3572 RepID=A0AAW1GUK8_SAPOF